MENIEERIKFRMDDENIPNEIFSMFGELVEEVVQLQKKNKEQKEMIENLQDYIEEIETHNHPNFKPIKIKMDKIRITKIDGQEFVTYKDYLRVKEENKNLNIIIENAKIEQKSDREHIEKLEEENKNLIGVDKKKAEHIDELEEENNKLKEENEKLRYTLDNISFSF